MIKGGLTKFSWQLVSSLKCSLFWAFHGQERARWDDYRCGLMFSHQSLLSQGHVFRRRPLETLGLPGAGGTEMLESALGLQSCSADGEAKRIKLPCKIRILRSPDPQNLWAFLSPPHATCRWREGEPPALIPTKLCSSRAPFPNLFVDLGICFPPPTHPERPEQTAQKQLIEEPTGAL